MTLIQRFGSAANLNIQLHGLYLDGVYDTTSETPVFHPVRSPTAEQVHTLLHTIIRRSMRLLIRTGHIVEEQETLFMTENTDETDTAMGPWIVTRDEIPDPQGLELVCRVNGKLKQHSNTRHQIFNVATTIAILSQGMTLEPGDVIATGTPSGVGFARKPPEFLQPGDVVECEVEKIGTIKNRIIEG